MNDLTTTPTADLIAEWEIYHSQVIDISQYGSNGHEWAEACCVTIAKELDRRIKSAGMRTVRDYPVFSEFTMTIYAPNDKDAREATLSITIAELRDLLTWLIQKGGNDA